MLSSSSLCYSTIEAAAALLLLDGDEGSDNTDFIFTEKSNIATDELSSRFNETSSLYQPCAFRVKEDVKHYFMETEKRKKTKKHHIASSEANPALKKLKRESDTETKEFVLKLGSKVTISDYINYFGLNSTQIEKLLQLVIPIYMLKEKHSARQKDPESLVLTGLATLASQRTYSELSSIFNKNKGTVCIWSQKFNSLLANHLSYLIKWPKDNLEAIKITFESACGFPSVVGAFGSCDVPLKCTSGATDPDFKNEKGFYSLVLSATCDPHSRFTSLSIDNPKNFQSTNGMSCQIIQSLLTDPESLIPGDSHVIAGRGFPLCNHILTPYLSDNDILNKQQKLYNEKLEETRSVILKTFSILRRRFQRLRIIDVVDFNRASSMIVAACILHNFVSEDEDLDGFTSSKNTPTAEHTITLDSADDPICPKRDRIALSFVHGVES